MNRPLNIPLFYVGLGLVTIVLTVVLKLWAPTGTIASMMAYGLIFAALFGATFWAWRRIDETAREAQKTAWLWGGGAGLVVAGAASAAMMTPATGLAGLLPAAAPEQLFHYGVLTTMLLQGAGFLIVWAGWWLAKR